MNQPLTPEIIELATAIAEKLGVTVVKINFQTNKKPPVLRIDIQKIEGDTTLDDCTKMSQLLSEILDIENIIPDNFMLEISSPGITQELRTERDFISFKGFPVLVKTNTPYKNKEDWRGNLQGRDEQAVYINQKGKPVKIPLELVETVVFDREI